MAAPWSRQARNAAGGGGHRCADGQAWVVIRQSRPGQSRRCCCSYLVAARHGSYPVYCVPRPAGHWWRMATEHTPVFGPATTIGDGSGHPWNHFPHPTEPEVAGSCPVRHPTKPRALTTSIHSLSGPKRWSAPQFDHQLTTMSTAPAMLILRQRAHARPGSPLLHARSRASAPHIARNPHWQRCSRRLSASPAQCCLACPDIVHRTSNSHRPRLMSALAPHPGGIARGGAPSSRAA